MDGAGTISGRWALAAGRAGVNGCRICGGPTLPGTRLCTQCKAALKRARQETVSELVPPPKRSTARAAARPRRTPQLAAAAPLQKSSRTRSWRRAATILATVAAVGIGYALVLLVRPAPSVPIVHPEPAESRPTVAPTAPPIVPRAEATAATAPAPARDAAPTAAVVAAAKPSPQRPAPKRIADTPAEPAPAPAVARFATATEPPTPVSVPEPVPAPRPAPPRDRWQQMTDAIAQCGRDGFFAGVVCEQRVRLQYCEGYWGQVAQCPNGIPNDHGD